MTATAEKTKAPVVADPPEPPPFTMPKVAPGQPILWHPYGEEVASHPPEIAFVIKSGNRSLSYIRTAEGKLLSGVPHISDPRLKESVEFRTSGAGAWDFTKEERAMRERFTSLETRLAAVEELLKKK